LCKGINYTHVWGRKFQAARTPGGKALKGSPFGMLKRPLHLEQISDRESNRRGSQGGGG
jgi:hypothetical protein